MSIFSALGYYHTTRSRKSQGKPKTFQKRICENSKIKLTRLWFPISATVLQRGVRKGIIIIISFVTPRCKTVAEIGNHRLVSLFFEFSQIRFWKSLIYELLKIWQMLELLGGECFENPRIKASSNGRNVALQPRKTAKLYWNYNDFVFCPHMGNFRACGGP